MATTNENENIVGTAFTPFDDSQQELKQQSVLNTTVATQGYNTTEIDPFRQGVSIQTSKHRFISNQPKLWSGNQNHAISIITYGQSISWTEAEETKIFEDIPRFDPVWYLQDENYPYPIFLNDGPGEDFEASLEPFTIPFRKTVNEDIETLRSPKGVLEDGNNFDNDKNASSRIQQFIPYVGAADTNYFLDAGQEYVKNDNVNIVDSIIKEGFVTNKLRTIEPFVDSDADILLSQISSSSQNYLSNLRTLQYNLDNDIRESYQQKSATAGNIVYGPEQARYGTDSIAFVGTYRGS